MQFVFILMKPSNQVIFLTVDKRPCIPYTKHNSSRLRSVLFFFSIAPMSTESGVSRLYKTIKFEQAMKNVINLIVGRYLPEVRS